ncbi:CatB-related O-acetyltransferase [Mucilaginibacter sp. UR6-11]|uniref:CatB-related O-acetyltransferase n=1 Tax=Mucilaginibacter sp. UR6-11 TaxID=1435644 RepID=UPI001E29F6FF|nr:CatB-related O-acetyltransferase [Mucilaginibacter sp. UR6-11]MCC8425727.1 CatB-related O-acetyltransferase [Mucilaginibacter sp. UR6-11]
MKKMIRKIALLFLKVFFPRLYVIEKQNGDIGRIIKNINRSTISNKAKIYGPAQIGDSQVDDYTYISGNSTISLTTIGKFCSIGPNFNCGFGIHPTNGLSTSPAFYSTGNACGITFSADDKIVEHKQIRIGNDVFIGINVTVIDGVTIGDGAVIGAGTVVSKDIPPYAIAVGSPVKVVKYRFDEPTINRLLKLKWWDFEPDNLKDVEKYFFDYQGFIEKYNDKV